VGRGFQKWLPIKQVARLAASAPDAGSGARGSESQGPGVSPRFRLNLDIRFRALCLRFMPRRDEKPIFAWLCWLPAGNPRGARAVGEAAFRRWRDDGAITEIPGGTFQLPFAIKATREAFRDFDVIKIGWDSWSAKEYYNALTNPPPATTRPRCPRISLSRCVSAPRRSARRRRVSSAACSTATRARQTSGRALDGWHCHVRFDENLNFVPAKKKSEKSIDLIMTAVMAEALSLPPKDTRLDDLIAKGEAVL
jgi:hypothetical protein